MIVVSDTTPLISLMKADCHISDDLIRYALSKIDSV